MSAITVPGKEDGKMKTARLAVLCCGVLALFVAAPAGAVTYDFEDLVYDTTYVVGNTFTTNGQLFELDQFQWGNLVWTSGGHAYVDNELLAGGSGLDLELNNINLKTSFSGPVSSLGLVFGEYGGNLNIAINGDFLNFSQLSDINGLTIGGCAIAVTNGFGNDQGTFLATGSIGTFKLGGQELWIDDIRTGDVVVPEPAGLGLLGLAMLVVRKKRT